jgi:PqqD family protein of HPr-rel-A system
MTDSLHRLQLEEGGRFLIKTWGDEAVAYDLLSGDTHFLDPLSLAITRYLSGTARSGEEIADHLASNFDLPTDEHSLDYLHATLSRLEAIGLLVVKSA